MRLLALILISAAVLASPAAAVKELGHDITFGPGDSYSGYYVPGRGVSCPGLVMIHEWWGLNSYIKMQAWAYSRLGYNVLAVDLFGRSTTDQAEAMKMVQALDQKAATSELLAAAEYLRSAEHSSGRVGSIGWCFGGGQSLTLALNDSKLDAAVIYYGQPVTDPALVAKIKCPILGLYGEDDKSIPLEKVRDFDKALTAAGVIHSIQTYPGAGHAFANPTRGTAYKPAAAKDANKRSAAFLAKYLKQPL
ncbi:MAG TPA: dienelactone hydrolase family protein [Armatimonadota bacterium]|jgi:carboxymethylenebutenolidase